MSKVNVVETRVKELLEQYPETRKSDELLYVTYIETYHYLTLDREIFINYEEHKLPSFKTVERVRRDILPRAKHIEIESKVQEGREEAEKKYRNYYGGKTND